MKPSTLNFNFVGSRVALPTRSLCAYTHTFCLLKDTELHNLHTMHTWLLQTLASTEYRVYVYIQLFNGSSGSMFNRDSAKSSFYSSSSHCTVQYRYSVLSRLSLGRKFGEPAFCFLPSARCCRCLGCALRPTGLSCMLYDMIILIYVCDGKGLGPHTHTPNEGKRVSHPVYSESLEKKFLCKQEQVETLIINWSTSARLTLIC